MTVDDDALVEPGSVSLVLVSNCPPSLMARMSFLAVEAIFRSKCFFMTPRLRRSFWRLAHHFLDRELASEKRRCRKRVSFENRRPNENCVARIRDTNMEAKITITEPVELK